MTHPAGREAARAICATLADATIPVAIRRIVGQTRHTGIGNFAMRLAPGGEVHVLACNARFFYKTDPPMPAGANLGTCGPS